jgi:hypothetical protein
MGGGHDLVGITFAENNAHWRQRDQEDDQIGSRHNAMRTLTTMTKGADDHDKEDPSEGKKICRCHQMGSGTNCMVPTLQKTMRIGGRGTGRTIELGCNAMQQ